LPVMAKAVVLKVRQVNVMNDRIGSS